MIAGFLIQLTEATGPKVRVVDQALVPSSVIVSREGSDDVAYLLSI